MQACTCVETSRPTSPEAGKVIRVRARTQTSDSILFERLSCPEEHNRCETSKSWMRCPVYEPRHNRSVLILLAECEMFPTSSVSRLQRFEGFGRVLTQGKGELPHPRVQPAPPSADVRSHHNALITSRMTAVCQGVKCRGGACGFLFFFFFCLLLSTVLAVQGRRRVQRTRSLSSHGVFPRVPRPRSIASVVRACFVRWRESKKKPRQTGWAGGVAIQRQTLWWELAVM
jgi:hypothetical protein